MYEDIRLDQWQTNFLYTLLNFLLKISKLFSKKEN